MTLPTLDQALAAYGLSVADGRVKLLAARALYPFLAPLIDAAIALLDQYGGVAEVAPQIPQVLAMLVNLVQSGQGPVSHDDTELA